MNKNWKKQKKSSTKKPYDPHEQRKLEFSIRAMCGTSGQWVHLKCCTLTTFLRLHDRFFCPHCVLKDKNRLIITVQIS